jgi:hypothetical protein
MIGVDGIRATLQAITLDSGRVGESHPGEASCGPGAGAIYTVTGVLSTISVIVHQAFFLLIVMPTAGEKLEDKMYS